MISHRAHLVASITAATLASALLLAGCAGGEPNRSPSPMAIEPTATEPAPTPTQASEPAEIGGPAIVEVASSTDVVTGLSAPWDIAFVPSGGFLVTERDNGVILRVDGGSVTELTGPGADTIRGGVSTEGEAGLLGLALHPDNPELLYVYFTRNDGNVVMRFDLDGTTLRGGVDVVAGIPAARIHDGGRIAFGPDGFLYITTGDAADQPLSQNVDSLAGKILRVVADGSNADGTAAPGNPFNTEVWAYGLRNSQGLGWVSDGRMYASEFGASGVDELNLIEPGSNYGWPLVEGRLGAPEGTGLGENVDGLTYPVAEWETSEASPSGIAVTDEGIYMAALRGRALWRIPLTATGIGDPHVLIDDVGRIRHVEVGPDGALYVLTNNTDGRGSPSDGDDRLIRITVE